LPVEIADVDIVREPDGLALSSRNAYLSAEERRMAPALYATLKQTRTRVQEGTPPADAEDTAMTALRAAGFRPDYVSVRRRHDLGEPQPDDSALVVLAAAWLGRTRLIDNLEFERTAF